MTVSPDSLEAINPEVDPEDVAVEHDLEEMQAVEKDIAAYESGFLSQHRVAPVVEQLQVGMMVQAMYLASHGGQDFFEGTIDRINDDGTYAIRYADGDREGYPEGDEHFAQAIQA